MAKRLLEPLIKTADGILRGQHLESVLGGSYYSFQGIPYAQPPVGSLRYQPPRRVEPWSGERLALAEGPSSLACIPFSTEFVENSSEDCLYLNVYTKDISAEQPKKPVLVWIHGGGFYFGSGNTDLYGPDFLVRKDIVLITINYRLGVLGFLSLQNEACPGNNGLRDQVEALRWVQRNVASFGGDPNNVTIFGESAGGASVQFLMLSPLSRGLFHRAITQSGSVFSPWALGRFPVAAAFKLGELLGFKTESKTELFEFLKTAPAKAIAEQSLKVAKSIEPDHYYGGNPFVPVVELPSSGAFLCENPEILVRNGQLHDVPYILGVNNLEGLVMAKRGLPPLNTINELERLLPRHPKLKSGTPLANRIVEKIRSFYFSNGYSEQRCADALSTIYFLKGNQDVLNGLSANKKRKSATYYYFYTFDCGISIFKPLLGFSNWKGTCHGDDISMLFYSNFLAPNIDAGSDYEKLINVFCELWTDFVRTGNPTPSSKIWPNYTDNSKQYLEISLPLKTGSNLYADEVRFWTEIFEEINRAPSPKL